MTNKGSGSKTQIIIAIIGLIGVLCGALFANWDKIFSPEQKSDINITNTDKISGTYLMDNQQHRVIVITHLSGNRYRIEEASSPWPWEGEATLDGGQLSGKGNFRKSLASMKVEGTIRGDKSIVISYTFIRNGDGNAPQGRIDNHIWYPKN